ncbi:type IV toxin-antitoxin system AbiEi family antitoxin domain-containing protein [Knoellia sp. CPCC 206450]|uniref:type IV toxin-antitoxin system AbiEi family antitoxin domain-containing protein n=1 Tax=Knoellia tibetensis TaxID=3404798 RepID=UPI003B434F6C
MTSLAPGVSELAASQHGVLTTAQASILGMGRRALIEAVRHGDLLHPGRSLYAVTRLVERTSPRAWHRSLASGALLLYPDAVFAGVTAVLAHGIDVWGYDLARPVDPPSDPPSDGGSRGALWHWRWPAYRSCRRWRSGTPSGGSSGGWTSSSRARRSSSSSTAG